MQRVPMTLAIAAAACLVVAAQDRLRTVPAYERYERMSREAPAAVRPGASGVYWDASSRAVEYTREGRRYRFDLTAKVESEAPAMPAEQEPRATATEAPDRGRQFTSALSPDGSRLAVYRDRNVYLGRPDGSGLVAVTTGGTAASRVKYGTASWVYGEELEQPTAMWWSPDSRTLAYYRFDEQRVPDFYLTRDQTHLMPTLEAEAYPLAGAANPKVDLFVYDVAARRQTRIDVRSGAPFDDAAIGHYVYRVEWTRDSRELLFLRMNRRQNTMEVAAADPKTGRCRVVVHESWPTGWVNEDPRLVFLEDGTRFIWESQRNGWNNFYLYDRSGRLLRPLTTFTTAEATTLIKIDEAAGVLFYAANDGDNPMKVQLHRVGLDGRGERRLTSPAYFHTVGGCIPSLRSHIGQPATRAPCGISPDNTYFIDTYETHDTPPATQIVDAGTGRVVVPVASSDPSTFRALGLRNAELFTYRAADGRTPLHGLIQFPSTFDPGRTYPALVEVYGGPEFTGNAARETFVTPSPLTELGFLVLNLDSRSVPGLGKRTLDAIYLKLGQADVDDLAEGVKALAARPYFDATRVGIFGTSYGGYMSVMALLRHPGLFAAAAASSPPTDWRNYDSIYTERYMWTPQANTDGYAGASAMRYAGSLRGRLLLYYGTADDNVHPSNALQLIKALQDAGKSLDVQVGPDRGHGSVDRDRMLEFFIDALKP